jgi:hypothetical protein
LPWVSRVEDRFTIYGEYESRTDLFEPMLVPERLAYPSSILGYVVSLVFVLDIDLTVDVELDRRA